VRLPETCKGYFLGWGPRLLATPSRAAVNRTPTRAGIRSYGSVLRIVELDRHDASSFGAIRRRQGDLRPVLPVIARVEERSAASSDPHLIADHGYHAERSRLVGENSRPTLGHRVLQMSIRSYSPQMRSAEGSNGNLRI